METSAEPLSLSPSLENYLEAIHEIAGARPVVRVRDIARRLKVRMPSVHAAVERLSQAGLVSHELYEYVELTAAGKEYARRVARRHRTLNRFLNEILGVSPRVAEEDACKVEHVVGPETMRRLVAFMDYLDARRDESAPWLARFLDHVHDADPSPEAD